MRRTPLDIKDREAVIKEHSNVYRRNFKQQLYATRLSHEQCKPVCLGIQQLGSDLQGGNLSAAQQDFVTLSQDAQSAFSASSSTASTTASTAASTSASTAASTTSSAQSSQSALAQEFQTLGQDLQSGDLTGAQQAFTQIQQDQQKSGSSGEHHHHHHAQSSSSNSSSNTRNC